MSSNNRPLPLLFPTFGSVSSVLVMDGVAKEDAQLSAQTAP